MKRIKIFKTNTLDGIWYKVNGQKYLEYVGAEDLTEITLQENNEHYGDYLGRLDEAILVDLGIKRWGILKENNHSIVWEVAHEDGSIYYVVELKFLVEYAAEKEIPTDPDAEEGYFKMVTIDFTGVAIRLYPTEYVGHREWEGLFALGNKPMWQLGLVRYLGNQKFMFVGFKQTEVVADVNVQYK